MGVCSYCFHSRSYDWGSECFSWDEARGCAGIEGSRDPKYIRLKREYKERKDRDRQHQLRSEIKETAARLSALKKERKDIAARLKPLALQPKGTR